MKNTLLETLTNNSGKKKLFHSVYDLIIGRKTFSAKIIYVLIVDTKSAKTHIYALHISFYLP